MIYFSRGFRVDFRCCSVYGTLCSVREIKNRDGVSTTLLPANGTITLVPAIEKLDAILDFLAQRENGATITQTSVALDLPKSTVHRILNTMEHLGYVQPSGSTGLYRLGYKLLMLSRQVNHNQSLQRITRPWLARLVEQTGETAKLNVVQGLSICVVDRVESCAEMKISVVAGAVFPIHAGAAGRLLLAHLPHNLRRQVLDTPHYRYTETTLVDRGALEKSLATIKARGYAFDNEECVRGISALACPVVDFTGDVIAAISVPFIANTKSDTGLEQILDVLSTACRTVSGALGCPADSYPDIRFAGTDPCAV